MRHLLAAFCIAALAGAAAAQPSTSENAKGATTGVFGLRPGQLEDCRMQSVSGRIVARQFAEDTVTLAALTLEYPGGAREIVNVEAPPEMAGALRDRVLHGLQRLSKVGRKAKLSVLYCGAAGRFAYLDEIR